MRDPAWRARTIEQALLALEPIPARPLTSTTQTDLSGPCRLGHSPTLINNPTRELPAPIQTERSVSVKLHPVSSLRLSCLAALRLQGGPDGPTYSGTTPSAREVVNATHSSARCTRVSGLRRDRLGRRRGRARRRR